MLTLTIDSTENAAFDDSDSAECARILREIADKLDDDIIQAPIWDANGNKVGWWALIRDED
jgi:hypothetical protein